MSTDIQIPVLQVIRQGIIGGGESHVISLVENIDRGKFRPVVLSFTDGPMVDTITRMGVPMHVIPTTTPFDVRVWGKVNSLLKKEGIKLVHAHGTRAASNVFWACRQNDIPMIYTIHGWSFHDNQSFMVRKFRKISEQFIVNKASTNISVSKSNQETGFKALHNFKSKVINNGINLSKFNPALTYQDIREQLRIPVDSTLFGFIARITIQKNPIGMLEAFASVAKQHNNVHLLMVGEGDMKEETLQKAASLGISSNITFMNFSSEVPALLNAIDVYCLPSFWEGLPIGLLEAMAMGKAVVASEVDGTKEIIKSLDNGILIDPNDTNSIAAAMIQLHVNKQLANKVRENAIVTIREKYLVENMTHEIEGVYENNLF